MLKKTRKVVISQFTKNKLKYNRRKIVVWKMLIWLEVEWIVYIEDNFIKGLYIEILQNDILKDFRNTWTKLLLILFLVGYWFKVYVYSY